VQAIRPRRGAGGRYTRRLGAEHLFADGLPDRPLVVDECQLALEPQVPRPREVDLHLELHPSGPRREDDHAVGEEHGLGDVVRDEDRRLLGLAPDAEKLLLHRLSRLRVERGERLVEQEQLRVGREGAREVDALLHTAGELGRPAVGEAGETDEIDQLPRDVAPFPLLAALHLEAVHHVARHGSPGKQARRLEDHRAVRTGRRDLAVVEQKRPGGDREQPVDGVEEGGLAAAGGTDDRDELTRPDAKVHALDGDERIAGPLSPVMDGHAPCFELHGHRFSSSGPRWSNGMIIRRLAFRALRWEVWPCDGIS